MDAEHTFISTDEEVAHLAQLIRKDDRLPVVVGTLREGEVAPPWDVTGLASRLRGEAEVFIVSTQASYTLTELMGGKANSVHSGWVRIYPAGLWKQGDQNRNRVAPEGRAANVPRKVAERVLELGFRGYVPPALPPTGLVEDTVTINETPSDDASALLTGRSKNDPTRYPIIRFSGLYPGIPANRLFKKGMVLRGSRTTGFLPDFFPDKPADSPLERFAAHVGDIACTWVLVGPVSSDRVSVFVHPEITLTVHGEGDDLTLQYSEGSVIKVLVMRSADGWEVLPAPDADIPIDALSALPGGPPWLLPPPTIVEEEPISPPTSTNAFDDEELIAANKEIERLRLEIEKLKDRFRTSRAKKAGLIHKSDELCLRADMHANYSERFSQIDRATYPMPEIIFNQEFIAAIPEVCQLVNYETLLRAIVNIAIGHPQTRTEKFKSGNPYCDEVDGWQFRRGHIADETHGAPRIRFAKKGDSIRFESAGHHDDDI